MTDREYRIPEHNLAEFRAKIEKLNQIALKLGCVPVAYAELRIEDIRERNEVTGETTGRITRYHIIVVKGEAPKLNGWSFIATLEHLTDGNVIKAVPGQADLPEQYRSSQPICDHCHKDWLHRKETFVLRNEQGELKQVGRQCLADFLGHQSPEQIANYASRLFELTGELDEDERLFDSMPSTYHNYDLVKFLAMTAAVIKARGWVSALMVKNGESNVSTRIIVEDQLTNRHLEDRDKIRPTSEHIELAERAINWIRNEVAPKTDYEHNIALLTKTDSFPIDNAGIVASLIPMYQREFEKREAAKNNPLTNSQYVGKEGDKIEVKVKVLRVIFTENGYGYRPTSTAIFKLQDAQGNLYTWFTQVGDLEQGREYTLKGAVKRHQEYKGIKETVLTRCKVISTEQLSEHSNA